MIVRHFGETCKGNFYDRDEVAREAKELMRRGVVLCALCGGKLKFHGCYPRRILDEESNSEHGWIAQGRCADCNAYPALIPDFVMPYKRYRAEVIERVIAESESGKNIESLGSCAADVSTMRRWISQFKERGSQAVGWLCSILLTLYDRHVNALELRSRTLLEQLTRLLREYPVLASGGVIGRANTILTTQNCGFL